MTEYREQLNEEQENQIINEEYKIWKKNCPYLYDQVITHELDQACLSVQWLPIVDEPADKDYRIHKAIVGTSSYENEPNSLQILKVRLPKEDALLNINTVDTNNENRIEIETRIMHDGEINKCRYCPQKYNVIATQTNNGNINIFDYSRHDSQPQSTEQKEQLVLKGHTKEGYGLSWNVLQEGLLASSSNDTTIKIWDIQQAKTLNQTVLPVETLQEHKAECNDVQFFKNSQCKLVSVSDDKCIMVWDLRQKQRLQLSVQGHESSIYSVDICPFDDKLLITGGGDNTVKLWDLRNMKTKVHSFENHTDEVIKVEFSPFNTAIFGSSSKDRRINIWDISKCGTEAKDIQDGPPELLFVHGGHKSTVDDFSFDLNMEFLIASVEQQYPLIQVWQMASILYLDDEDMK